MKKQLAAVMLAAATGVSVLAGCGSSGSGSGNATTQSAASASGTSAAAQSGGLDTSKEVNLVMYVISNRPAGQDAVDENLNKLLKEKLNCTLTINWIPWSDYANKYPLLFSSGEQFDMAYTSNWLNWTQLARKGAFMQLDDLWPTYAPDNWAATSEMAKAEATIDGHLYVVPTQKATYTAYGPIYRTKFDDGKEYTDEITDMTSMETYLDWIKANEPDLKPYQVYSAGSEMDDMWMYSQGFCASKGATNDFLFYNPEDENPKLFTYYEYDGVNDFLDMMEGWNGKGYYSKSALSDTDSTQVQNGLAAMQVHNIDTYSGLYILHPDWGFKYVNLRKHVAHLPYTQDSMAISTTSQNPERALALWNLLTTDQEVYDAFYYGILDTSYTLDDKGEFKITDPDTYATSAMWAVRTNELDRNGAGTPDDYVTQRNQWEEDIKSDDTAEKYAAFTIDTTNIETEYAACQSVQQQYWWPLELGFTDKESGLKEYQEKMEAAGIEKVRTEIQGQLDAYVATLK